jgi:hypothetical protein
VFEALKPSKIVSFKKMFGINSMCERQENITKENVIENQFP